MYRKTQNIYVVLGIIALFLGACTSLPHQYEKIIVSPTATCSIPELKNTNAIIRIPQKEKNNITSLANKAVFIPSIRTFTNHKGKSILSLAINVSLYDQIPIIIKSGININQQDACGNTALMYLVISNKSKNIILPLISMFIANNANVNLQNNDGKTALMLAAEYGTTPITAKTILIEGNADPGLLDTQGNTAWDMLQKNAKLSSSFMSRLLAVNAQQKYIEIIKNSESEELNRISTQNVSSSGQYKNSNFLMWAAQYTNNPRVTLESFIKITDINDTDTKNRNALFYAINNIHGTNTMVQTITILINAGINIDHQDNEGNTALLYALQNHAPSKVVLLLIKHGINVNIRNNQGCNALFVAAMNYTNVKIFKKLFSKNMDMNATNSDNVTSLMFLSQGVNVNNTSVFKLFINKYKANVDKLDKYGNLAIHYAAKNTKKSRIIQLLLPVPSMALQGNAKGKTALHIAAQYNTNINIVNELVKISKAFAIQVKDSAGKIAVMYSAEHNPNVQITNYLLKTYKESYLQTDENGNTPFMFSVLNMYSDEVFHVLLKKEKNIDRKNHSGNTVLAIAAEFSHHPTIIKSLINKKASINLQNNKGQTALMLAMRNKYSPDMAELLISANAKTDIVDNNNVPAIIYAARDSIFIDHIRILRKAKVRDEYITKDKQTTHDLLLNNKYLAPYIR